VTGINALIYSLLASKFRITDIMSTLPLSLLEKHNINMDIEIYGGCGL
jgi:hypothetical protein